MNTVNKIFNELRRLKFEHTHLWIFQQYKSFCSNNLDPIEAKEFHNVMTQLCKDGFFDTEIRNKMPAFRLTLKGEHKLWQNM